MDGMSEILFIRHAETDMAGTFCGLSDPDLNKRGYVQLAELIDKLRTEDIGAVYTSDLRRSRATASAVAETFGVDCHVRRALREISFGQWEGLTWEQIEQRNKSDAQRWVAEYPNFSAPGGENVRDFERRVFDEIEVMSMEAQSLRRSFAVITHAGVLRSVLRVLHGCSEEEAWNQTRSYCSIVRHHVTHPFLIRQKRNLNDLDETGRIQGENL
jgi:alpha-ribazole phosphatase